MPQSTRISTFLIILSLGFTCFALPTVDLRAEDNWQLVWHDEFETDGLPNTLLWNYETGYLRNEEAQYYTAKRPENARVENGNLILEAHKADLPGHAYTAASITSRAAASWTYGRLEVRAQIPAGRGTWPAIWMLGDNIADVGWPACGEIDIMEYVGYQPDVIHGTVHTTTYNHAIGTGQGSTLTVPTAETEMHVYAIEWTPDKIDFFVDETKYFTFENDHAANDSTWPFHRPQHLKLNLAIGGSWGGQQGIDDSIFPCQYLIDYVRVYQQKTDAPYTISTQAVGPGQLHIIPQKESYDAGEQVEIIADPDIGMRLANWNGILPERSLRLTTTVDRDLDIAAIFSNPQALNTNTSFDAGLDSWYTWFADAVTASARIVDGAARVSIFQNNTAAWEAQLGQGNLTLTADSEYALTFDAWAQAPHDIVVTLARNYEPFTAYATKTFTLTTEPQTFTLPHIHNSPTDANTRIEFDLATSTGTLFIDNVSLNDLSSNTLPPYEAWKKSHNIRPLDDHADPDNDSVPNIVEYYFQTDPNLPNTIPNLATPSLNQNAQPSLTLATSPLPESDLQELVTASESSSNLTSWTSDPSQTPTPGVPSFTRIRLSATPPIAN